VTTILKKAETHMLAHNTRFGEVPARLRTAELTLRATLYLLKAAAREKPPKTSIMTGENMAEKMNLAASLAGIGCGCASGFVGSTGVIHTRSVTTRNGINIDVTNSGTT
jgi:hypothetical protein